MTQELRYALVNNDAKSGIIYIPNYLHLVFSLMSFGREFMMLNGKVCYNILSRLNVKIVAVFLPKFWHCKFLT